MKRKGYVIQIVSMSVLVLALGLAAPPSGPQPFGK